MDWIDSARVKACRAVCVLALAAAPVLGFGRAAAQALSYALALSAIPTRSYLAGCALALAPVVALAVFATGWFS